MGLPCLTALTLNAEAPFPLPRTRFYARLRLFCLLNNAEIAIPSINGVPDPPPRSYEPTYSEAAETADI